MENIENNFNNIVDKTYDYLVKNNLKAVVLRLKIAKY